MAIGSEDSGQRAGDEATQHHGKVVALASAARGPRLGPGPRGGIVTREAVFQAAEELDAKYGRATMHGVRAVLGGGSMTPIAEHLRAYRAAKLKAASASPEELLTAPLREAFVVALGNAQAEARKACATELEEGEAQRQEFMEAMVELEAERNRLRDQVDELEVTVAELREQAARHEASHREHERERDGIITALTQDRDVARKTVQALQMQMAAAEAGRTQAETVAEAREAEHRRAHEALEVERRACAETDKALAVAHARAVAHEKISERMERELESAHEGMRELRTSVDRLREEQRNDERASHKLALDNAALSADLKAEKDRVARLLRRQVGPRASHNTSNVVKSHKSNEVTP